MARVTRSQKIIISEDDTIIATHTPLPSSPGKVRSVLGEISHNMEDAMTVEDVEMENQLKGLKAAYKTAIGVKKHKKGKKYKKIMQEPAVKEVGIFHSALESGENAIVSSTTKATHQMSASTTEQSSLTDPLYGTTEVDLTRSDVVSSAGDITVSLSSPAIYAAQDQTGHDQAVTANVAKSSVFEKQTLQTSIDRDNTMGHPQESKSLTLDEVERCCANKSPVLHGPDNTDDDSFVEQITIRSPAKPSPRIEDSVDELDKMAEIEEALDEVTMAEQLVIEKNKKVPVKPSGLSPSSHMETVNNKRTVPSLRLKSKRDSNAIFRERDVVDDLTQTRLTPSLHQKFAISMTESVTNKDGVPKKPLNRPSSLLPPKPPVKAAKRIYLPTFELPGEAVARKLKEQREARKTQLEASNNTSASIIARSTASRVKSAKPPTKPTFELPGEALSRQKREMHEARLKAVKEEEKKRREFKAKPIRKSTLPDVIPRDTIASRARKSQLGISDLGQQASNKLDTDLSVSKRSSIVGGHRPSIHSINMANVSAPRAPGPSLHQTLGRKPSTTSGPSMSGLNKQRQVSATDAQNQRQRAKEIYNRDMKAIEEIEREKREREAAARKSREVAAERGRQASREWAEKQRAKKALESDRGMSAGYGPGGQMGLKA